MTTTNRTPEQTAYLSTLARAASEMREATKRLAAQATASMEFTERDSRPGISAQASAEAMEKIAVLNALIDMGGLMKVSSEDFKNALATKPPYWV